MRARSSATSTRADDLVQDTLERAINKRHLWRPGSDLRAWLFAIMHNVFVNQLRSRRAHPEEALDDDALPAVAPSDGAQLEIRDLQTALAALPPSNARWCSSSVSSS